MMLRDTITVTITGPRQAVQRTIRLARKDALASSSRRERVYMAQLAADLEAQLNASCTACNSSRFIANPKWRGYQAPAPDDWSHAAEIEDLHPDADPDAAARALFAAQHGPELLPCPRCRPAERGASS